MKEFTIRCTLEQTKRALALGAPIEIECFSTTTEDHWYEVVPTTEQMIGWLRSQGFRFKIEELSDTVVAYRATFGYWYKCGQRNNPKGATHAVIDAALKYLENMK